MICSQGRIPGPARAFPWPPSPAPQQVFRELLENPVTSHTRPQTTVEYKESCTVSILVTLGMWPCLLDLVPIFTRNCCSQIALAKLGRNYDPSASQLILELFLAESRTPIPSSACPRGSHPIPRGVDPPGMSCPTFCGINHMVRVLLPCSEKANWVTGPVAPGFILVLEFFLL